MTIDIETARSEHALKRFIDEHLRGKEISPNAAIEVHSNGYTLSDYRGVQHGDTLQISLVRHGLYGGSMFKKDRIHPGEEESELIPIKEQKDVDENFVETEWIE